MSHEQLMAIGFKKLGKNVLISDKTSFYNADQIEIGDYSRIDDFCVISGKVTLGRNVHIAVFCNLAAGTAGITMDDFSGISYGCHIFSQSADYSGKTIAPPTVPSKYKDEIKQAIYIGRHCAVGVKSVIFPGVTLAEGTSVGAMSMVLKSTEPWSIYVGIPAKKIKDRKRDLLELIELYLAEEGSDA
jgi:galactoside O-acetyltransferase